ncbi:MAG TPA: hypothetical protein VF596_09455 [Pyrinomonadaceae bacterium]|jgi:hypothetical protein
MIKHATKIFLTLSILMVVGLTAAQAQIDSDTIIDTNIPFQFVVGNTTFPAGKYVIKPMDDSDDMPSVIEIQSANGKMSVVFETENSTLDNAPKKTEVIFDSIGGKYFLSQIFVEGQNYGVRALESKMEKKLKNGGAQAVKQSVSSSKRKSALAASAK